MCRHGGASFRECRLGGTARAYAICRILTGSRQRRLTRDVRGEPSSLYLINNSADAVEPLHEGSKPIHRSSNPPCQRLCLYPPRRPALLFTSDQVKTAEMDRGRLGSSSRFRQCCTRRRRLFQRQEGERLAVGRMVHLLCSCSMLDTPAAAAVAAAAATTYLD